MSNQTWPPGMSQKSYMAPVDWRAALGPYAESLISEAYEDAKEMRRRNEIKRSTGIRINKQPKRSLQRLKDD